MYRLRRRGKPVSHHNDNSMIALTIVASIVAAFAILFALLWTRTRATVLFVTHSLVEAVYLADAVLIMGAGPGRIIERITVDLPRPRTMDMVGSEALGALRNRIWHLIADVQP